MKPADVRKQIRTGETAPLYLLEGDDPHSRNDLASEFASMVDEDLHAFNVQSFYANEATTAAAREQLIADLLAAARTLPMMAPRRVLTVHEAERLLSPRKGKDDEAELPLPDALRKRKRGTTPSEQLEEYFESPEPSTTMVFVAAGLDNNRRLVKLLRKHGVGVECGALESQAEAAKWIKIRLEKDGLDIEPQAISVLLGATGLHLGRIRAEIEKLALFAAGDGKVTPRHVREMVTAETAPGEDFALGRAIWSSNARAGLREVTALLDTGMPSFMVLGQIRAAARSLKPDARAKRALDAVFQADLDIKSSVGEPRFLLERLVIELCAR